MASISETATFESFDLKLVTKRDELNHNVIVEAPHPIEVAACKLHGSWTRDAEKIHPGYVW